MGWVLDASPDVMVAEAKGERERGGAGCFWQHWHQCAVVRRVLSSAMLGVRNPASLSFQEGCVAP